MINKLLSIEEYNHAEDVAMSMLPTRLLDAFQPIVSTRLGYPYRRAKSERELWKCVEFMIDPTIERSLGSGVSVDEFELVRQLTRKILLFSQSSFEMKLVPKASTMRMINVLRHIQYIFGDDRPRVFEIGPGNGVLGVMLMLRGYPYAATDVTQTLYLYQNHLWNYITDGKVIELAHDSKQIFGPASPGGVVHVPWWEFAKTRLDGIHEFDVVTCNHALNEMEGDALKFTLKISRALLRGNNAPKVFLFRDWGGKNIRSSAQTTELFYRYGFELVHHSEEIAVFAVGSTDEAVDSLTLPRNLSPWVTALRNTVRRIGGAPASLTELGWTPDFHKSTQNPLSRAIIREGQSRQEKLVVNIEEIRRFFTTVIESGNYGTPGEEFTRFLDP